MELKTYDLWPNWSEVALNIRERISTMKTTKLLAALFAATLLVVSFGGCDSNRKPYETAQTLFTEGNYAEAAAAFEALGDYKDSAERAQTSKISGSWSIIEMVLRETGAQESDIKGTVPEENLKNDILILAFDGSGGFRSENTTGQFTEYTGWKFVKEDGDGTELKGRLEFSPTPESFTYSLSVSNSDVMTITFHGTYYQESKSVNGYMTKEGDVTREGTLTLIRTPQ